MTAADALRILGVTGEADADALRAAFRDAAKRAHPDHHGGDGERLRLIIEAYRTLRPRRRGPAPRRPASPADHAHRGHARGVAASASLAEGRQVTVRLPPGLREGEVLSVDGQTRDGQHRRRGRPGGAGRSPVRHRRGPAFPARRGRAAGGRDACRAAGPVGLGGGWGQGPGPRPRPWPAAAWPPCAGRPLRLAAGWSMRRWPRAWWKPSCRRFNAQWAA